MRRNFGDSVFDGLLYGSSQNMHCILPPTNGVGGVYLGNIDAADDRELLRRHSI